MEKEAKTVKPEPAEKEGKFTKEGRKIIDAGPKPNQFKSKPSSPPAPTTRAHKKKGSFMRRLGKSLLIVLILVMVIIWIFPDKENDKLTDTSIPGIVDIKQEKGKNTSVTDKSPGEKKNKKTILDANDPGAADKYRYGIGIDGDQYKAFELYEKLADKGDLNAMVELSDYYEQGIWVKKDTKKAMQLLKKAADAGSLAAKWQLEFLESENKSN
ncbi:MAG TPA: tetratricopeptide repeat protein [Draconibacterium sp.]|nr:tetratricopeptide repeat protein [Draconibacterium sp.]